MRHVVLGFLCLAAVIAYVQRSAISVPAGRIQAELELTGTQLGLVMGAWYLGYAILQLPSGWLADRIGSTPALVLFCAVWSVLTGMVGLATGFLGLLGLWFAMGLAQAGIFPCATKAIGGWYADQTRARAAGLLIVAQLAGGALAPRLTAELLPHLSWQAVFALYAIPGLLWAAAFWLLTPRWPPHEVPTSEPVDWGRMVRSGSMHLLFAQQFLRGAAMAFFFTWFPRFLQAQGATEADAGRLTAWPGVGAMIGALLGGLASDALLRLTGRPRVARQGVAVAGMFLCAALTLAAPFAADLSGLVLLFSVGVFWGAFGGVSGYSVAIAFGGRRVGVVFAAMNMGGNIGASLFAPLVGVLIDQTGDWNLVVYLFAALFAADGVLWALLNPTRPLFEDANANHPG